MFRFRKGEFRILTMAYIDDVAVTKTPPIQGCLESITDPKMYINVILHCVFSEICVSVDSYAPVLLLLYVNHS